MSTVAQPYDQSDNVIIVPAILTNSSVLNFSSLHDETQSNSSNNLRLKTESEIHRLIADGAMFGAWMNEYLIGMISVRKIPKNEHKSAIRLLKPHLGARKPDIGDIAEINSWAVKPGISGIGHQLLAYALNHAKQNGLSDVFSKVRDGNEQAKKILLRNGFNQCSRATRDDGTPLLVLARTL